MIDFAIDCKCQDIACIITLCTRCRPMLWQDYHFHEHGASNGGNRYATILAYLSDVEAGGETVSSNLHSDCSSMLHAKIVWASCSFFEQSCSAQLCGVGGWGSRGVRQQVKVMHSSKACERGCEETHI